jgi:predicted RNase H-like nuclease
MKVAGIDSCPLGWIVILYEHNKLSFEAVESIDELIELHPDLDRIFIDIPIGLSSKKFTRSIEFKLRKELGNRSSTIFTPACRKAIYAADYDQARAINKEILGKSISIQSYNISKKIKEVDQFLKSKTEDLEIYESHPEICFKYLKDSEVIQSKKSTQEGFQERFELLLKHDSEFKKLYHSITEKYLKSKVKPDDILDAMVLCVANSKSDLLGLRFVEDENNVDDQGLFVKVAY